MSLEIDFETQSDVDIKECGAYLYFESPLTRPLFASYKLNGGAVKRWDASEPCPPEIVAHVASGGEIHAHNAAFERQLWQKILTPRYGWPKVRTEQFRCVAAQAAALNLPRDLEGVGRALDLPIKKDKEGRRLINLFSVPRKPRKDEAPDGLYFSTPEEYPEDWEKFKAYCDIDVVAESGAEARMVPLSDFEQKVYHLDQKINDRGIRVDQRSAFAALRIAEKATAALDAEMTEVTGGAVTACSQVARLVAWVEAQGVVMNSAAKDEIEELLSCDDLPDNVRRAVLLRQEAAKTAGGKLLSFLKRTCRDGRLRGAFLFNGAGTGRWSSVGAQLHNLPRPRGSFSEAHLDPAVLFGTIRQESPELLKTFYGETLGRPLHLLSDAVRGFLWAAPGHDFVTVDYSGIEGAVAAWFCGEDWKVAALWDLIRDPSLPDLYRRTAAGIYGTVTDLILKKDPRRQVGKVSELSLQYQGGVGAFRSMAKNYGLKLDSIYDPVWASADGERRERALKRYEECLERKELTTQVLTQREWLGAELVKVGWRASNPAIKLSWSLLEDAIFEAVSNPGTPVKVLKVSYLVKHGFLWCLLPSGRCLAWGAPRISEEEVPWADKTQEPEVREKKLTVTVKGVDAKTKQWVRYALYGGLALENVVQAIARDILVQGMLNAEEAGYPVVLHCHDELAAEVKRGFGSVEELERLACVLPSAYEGLPLAASGWRGKRYKKD